MFGKQISFFFLLILLTPYPLLFVICPFQYAAACRWLVLSRSYQMCCAVFSHQQKRQAS